MTPSDAELGRIGTNGQKAEVFDTIEAAGQAREAVASAKRRPGVSGSVIIGGEREGSKRAVSLS
ncbi:hypothetical protein [Microvirga tunisiensis]|uniref:Uncharacterized protein n=1 Tax=Microvirga tunisiensis TaxID=2108360 RepID=A0A5N7MW29_9HYPH|nr:hypothetical protein [Microvirga tunisiensis]MPR13289.1 hypothetical protein [Microvirga tunisiensis]MPR31162.1 hypothetical protein [Microvirga tunisiensis]